MSSRFTSEAWLFLGPLAVAVSIVALVYRSVIAEVARAVLAR